MWGLVGAKTDFENSGAPGACPLPAERAPRGFSADRTRTRVGHDIDDELGHPARGVGASDAGQVFGHRADVQARVAG